MAKQTYQLLARLADRGMGETYLARLGEGTTARLVALERLPRSRAGDADAVRTFLESARAGAQLSHPNVAQIVDAGRLGTSYFVATELVDGEPLRAVIEHAKAQGRLQVPLRAVLTIAAGIAAGLHHAHERKSGDGAPGVVHGNLTPASVIISRDGIVKLFDFGVPSGGALAYRSPEQLRGEPVDARSDLFSLGAVLHELLTREPLFERASEAQTRIAIAGEVVAPPSKTRMDVPAELDAIVLRLLSKEPRERYADADDLLVDIEALATKLGFPISTTDLARVMRVWFGAAPNLSALEAAATVDTEELSTEPGTSAADVDRALDKVPGVAVAMFESESAAESAEDRRAANPTPPPVDVPIESFQEIRDRILGSRNKADSAGANPRAHAYTRVPATGEPSRTATLQGISPTAITDVISRVTQAASAAGAATRQTVAAALGTDTVPTGESASDAEAPEIEMVAEAPVPEGPVPEAPAMAAAAVKAEPEHPKATGINGNASGLDVMKAMAAAEAAEASGPTKAAGEPGATSDSGELRAKSDSQAQPRTKSESKAERRAKSESKARAKSDSKAARGRSDSKGATALDASDATPEAVAGKEPSTKVALSRTASSEWFERGEREAKEAHAAAARALAKGYHEHDHDHTPDPASASGAHGPARRRPPGLLYPVLGVAAAALVIIALVKIATREPNSKTPRHDGKALALATGDAAGQAPAVDAALGAPAVDAADRMAGSAATGSGSELTGGGTVAGSAAAGSATVAGAGSAAAMVAMPDAAVAMAPDAAVAPPIDAAAVAVAKVDAAVVAIARPDAAVDHAKTADTTKTTKTADTTKTTKPAEPANETIEQMFEKGAFAKANQACATNTRFNPTRLEECALAACNVKDTALATRWLRAIDRAARDGVLAKCKDLGLELQAP